MNLYTFQRRNELVMYFKMANSLNGAGKVVISKRLSEELAIRLFAIDAHYLRKKVKDLSNLNLFNAQKSIYTTLVRLIVSKTWTEDEVVKQIEQIDPLILSKELKEARQVGLKNYSFDRQINYNESNTWSYMDEKSLLDELRNWITSGQAAEITKLSVFEQLSKLAYEYARNNCKDYPRGWDVYKETDVYWLKRFDMRHHDAIEGIFGDLKIPELETEPVFN